MYTCVFPLRCVCNECVTTDRPSSVLFFFSSYSQDEHKYTHTHMCIYIVRSSVCLFAFRSYVFFSVCYSFEWIWSRVVSLHDVVHPTSVSVIFFFHWNWNKIYTERMLYAIHLFQSTFNSVCFAKCIVFIAIEHFVVFCYLYLNWIEEQ